jgi:hypothetical protein
VVTAVAASTVVAIGDKKQECTFASELAGINRIFRVIEIPLASFCKCAKLVFAAAS